jgi:D-alanine--D-alanine ligase
MQKIRVGVFMGGKSIEREVSFNSGRTVCDHLDTSHYEIIPIFQTLYNTLYILPLQFLHRGKISDFEHKLVTHAKSIEWDTLPDIIDFVYIATHGNYAEDGTLQGFLEVLGIPYLGSGVLASAFSMNKIMQKNLLKAHGIHVPKGISLTPAQIDTFDLHAITRILENHQVTFPCIVKPYKEGSSLGVHIVFKAEELHQAVVNASRVDPLKRQAVLIEEKIEGMEFSCITITDHKTNTLIPLPPTEIIIEKGSHFFDYEQKYMPGRSHKRTPPHCAESLIQRIQDTCVQVMRVLDITNISRIDGFVTPDERIVIIDPNTLSGMGPSSFLFREAAEIGMSHTHTINHLIETELHYYGMVQKADEQVKNMDNISSMVHKKIRVAVLMGGASNEREISLESGRNITYKLSPHTYDALPIFIDTSMKLFNIPQSLLVRSSTEEIASLVTPAMQVRWQDLPAMADFVFIALHGGHGENGAVQGTLEMLGLPYNGSSVLTSALCMDKYKTTEFLKHQGFDVPQGYLVSREQWQADKEKSMHTICESFTFPFIVKPHNDGCSVMVAKVCNKQELLCALEDIFNNSQASALVEELITGMELTVGVIGNDNPHALSPSQAVALDGILSITEKFLPGAGENQTPAPLPEQTLRFVRKIMEEVFVAVQCRGYARIDCFYQSAEQSPTGCERVIILEINTLPGMTPATCIFHQAAEEGMRPMEFIDKIIQLGLQEHGKDALLGSMQTSNEIVQQG